jgi:SAM-dependent methyltransferase
MPANLDQFLSLVRDGSPEMKYNWTAQKEVSCQWIIDRIPDWTKVLDVGGTEWMCEQLSSRDCDVTYFDLVPPKCFSKFVQADMMDVMAHFRMHEFDVITTRHTLEHALMPLFQLWCYNQLLRDGGRLFVIVPTHIREWVWFGTHHSCLPMENWLMLFYRAGFKIIRADAGSWGPNDVKFIEHRFELAVEARSLRLKFEPPWFPS